MALNVPFGVSQRTKRIVLQAIESYQPSDNSGDESDDSYIGQELRIVPHESVDDEYEDEERLLQYADEVQEIPAEPISISTPIGAAADSDSEDDVPRGPTIRSNRPSSHRIISSESEDEISDLPEESENEYAANSLQYHGKKNCFTWLSHPVLPSSQTRAHNVINVRCSKLNGPALSLGNNPTPGKVWDLFFSDQLIEEITTHTNAKLEKTRSKLLFDHHTYKPTNADEIKAFIGILVLCCIYKSSHESVKSLFSTTISGRPIFRGIMTEKRFEILQRNLRFDDSETRTERQKTDITAPITKIFEIFMSNCQQVYSPGAHLTVDETLVSFRGRVKFLVYNPMKPAKYGIKVMGITDAHNAYIFNAYIYSGKGSDGQTLTPEEQQLKIPTQAVVRLAKSVYGTKRNITTDNWFTSIELGEELWKNKLTLVGTMRKNKPQIPKEFLANKNREVPSCLYGYSEKFTLLSYVPKKNKAVVLLSSMHHTPFTDSNGKPEIISFYNVSKGGVDTLDFKASCYSANRRTRRWPMAMFYHMVSMAASNAHILYGLFKDTKDMNRYDFLRNVALCLVHNHVKARQDIPNLPDDLKKIISQVEDECSKVVSQQSGRTRPENQPGQSAGERSAILSDKLESRKTCRFCPYTKKRKTAYQCIRCQKPGCLECLRKVCNSCAESNG